MAQLVTRIDDTLVRAVDALVEAGVVQSRSEAVRRGLEAMVENHRRAREGQAIVDGYLRIPQTDEEIGWADEAARRMIAEEPW
jgi:Arc/MetJ-type ribon-helix-helix transcriptional regulator